jgi:hypothetical protein
LIFSVSQFHTAVSALTQCFEEKLSKRALIFRQKQLAVAAENSVTSFLQCHSNEIFLKNARCYYNLFIKKANYTTKHPVA